MSKSMLSKTLFVTSLCALLITLSGCEAILGVFVQEREQDRVKAEQEAKVQTAFPQGKLTPSNSDQKQNPSTPPSQSGETESFSVDVPTGEVVEIFKIINDRAVFNGGTTPVFTLNKKTYITILNTYHWNDEKGKEPGTISITDNAGKKYGEWKATSAPGQGGVPNAYWIVNPNIYLDPGTYIIIDSDPTTLSQNPGTGGMGMAWASGIPQ